MRFFHLSDLHIGKQLHHYNLKDDQKAVLDEIVEYAEKWKPDAVIIAGDIYDKAVPSGEAVTIFDEFLTGLAGIRPVISILIISGNHDSAERLQYAAGILRQNHIYVAGNAPGREKEHIDKVTFTDEYGEVDVYLLPFMKPSYVKNVFSGRTPESYSEAVDKIIRREKIDYAHRRNILVSHQFYMGSSVPETCDSETVSVGGIDRVDTDAVEQFDYVALGHLHGRQQVKAPYIRYCGSPLKYSVSEAGHTKCLTMVTLKEKGVPPEITELALHPVREVRRKKGALKEMIEQAKETERDDYISITLTDEVDSYRPKDQLDQVYSHILEIRVENSRTRKRLSGFEREVPKEPLEAFCEFYMEMQGRDITEEELRILRKTFDEVREG